MSFPAYASYTATDIVWCSQLPSHWTTRRLKTLFQLMKRPPEEGDKIVTAFRDGQVTLRERRREEGFTNALQEIGYQRVLAGDLVIHAMDGFAGAIGVSDADGKSTPVYSVCTPALNADAHYFALLLRHMALSGFVTALAKGVRERSTDFRWSDASVLDLPCPPLSEQREIVSFLDRETAKIDALVEEQRRLIELLKEKRQAVISHAVTKGLDLTVPMKDSGVEWLGGVPAHWSVAPLRYVARVQTGVAKGKDLEGRIARTVPYLRVANVQDGHIDLTDVAEIEIAEHDVSRYLLRRGDVLMNEGGDFDKLGRGDIWQGQIDPCVHQNHVFAVRPTGVSAEWLNLITSSSYAQQYFMTRSKQSTNLASISSRNVMNLPVVLPPPSEQASLVARVGEIVLTLAEMRETAEGAVKLLQERRAALISAAVTGKIDVRDAAIQRAEAA